MAIMWCLVEEVQQLGRKGDHARVDCLQEQGQHAVGVVVLIA